MWSARRARTFKKGGGLPAWFALPQNGKEGSRPLPTNNRKVSYNSGKCKFPAGL